MSSDWSVNMILLQRTQRMFPWKHAKIQSTGVVQTRKHQQKDQPLKGVRKKVTLRGTLYDISMGVGGGWFGGGGGKMNPLPVNGIKCFN